MLFITKSVGILLAGCLVTGCVQAGKNSSATVKALEKGAASMKSSSRAIIYFSQLPSTEDYQFIATLSQACQCVPVFIRQYGNNAMIYELSLPQHISFNGFEKSLLEAGKSQGVQAVEQDALMQPQ